MDIEFDDLPLHFKQRLLKLAALEAHGVDNWMGYDDAMDAYYDSIAGLPDE